MTRTQIVVIAPAFIIAGRAKGTFGLTKIVVVAAGFIAAGRAKGAFGP